MDVNAWLAKLKSFGFTNMATRPKLTIGLYVTWVTVRWVAIAVVILVAVSIWFIISIVTAGLKATK